jgi:uncharacterized protein (PEP-CTERM system associated)
MTTWRIQGSRDSQTFREQVYGEVPIDTRQLVDAAFSSRITDPVEREQAVDQYLLQTGLPAQLIAPFSFYSNQVYLSNRINASVGLFGRHNALTLSAFARRNEPLTSVDLGTASAVISGAHDIYQRGASIAGTHNFSPLLWSTISASRIYSESQQVVQSQARLESTQDVFRLTVTRRLSPKTFVLAGARRVTFDSNVPSNSYTERAVFATITHRF